MSEWKTIDSAPKDGTKVKLKNTANGLEDYGYWHDYKGRSMTGIEGEWDQDFGNGYMTHWMPLPTPLGANDD